MSKILDLLSNDKTYALYLKEMSNATTRLEPVTKNLIRFWKTFDSYKKSYIECDHIHFMDLPGLFFLLSPMLNGNQHYELCQDEINRTYYEYDGNNLDIYTKFSSGNFIKTFSTTLNITDCV